MSRSWHSDTGSCILQGMKRIIAGTICKHLKHYVPAVQPCMLGYWWGYPGYPISTISASQPQSHMQISLNGSVFATLDGLNRSSRPGYKTPSYHHQSLWHRSYPLTYLKVLIPLSNSVGTHHLLCITFSSEVLYNDECYIFSQRQPTLNDVRCGCGLRQTSIKTTTKRTPLHFHGWAYWWHLRRAFIHSSHDKNNEDCLGPNYIVPYIVYWNGLSLDCHMQDSIGAGKLFVLLLH